MTPYAIPAWRRIQRRMGRLRLAVRPGPLPVAPRSPRAATLAAIGASLVVAACSWTAHDVHADGIVWQVDNSTTNPVGNWQMLGIHDLLIQWTVVDDTAFIASTSIQPAAHLPDWERIGREPWARNVILGLAGYQDEKRARTHLSTLADQSLEVARAPVPLHVTGYYFPVEIDPTWQDAPKLAAVLQRLPRPLWVSVYDQTNIGGKALADWLAAWLPADVGVFFQDGCGVYAREPYVARAYLDELVAKLGKSACGSSPRRSGLPSGADSVRPAPTSWASNCWRIAVIRSTCSMVRTMCRTTSRARSRRGSRSRRRPCRWARRTDSARFRRTGGKGAGGETIGRIGFPAATRAGHPVPARRRTGPTVDLLLPPRAPFDDQTARPSA